MRVAVLGTGMVGQALARRLAEQGHEVTMGSRTADNDRAVAFAEEAGDGASAGTFAQAAESAEVVILAVKGEHALAVLEQAGAEHLGGKVLVDVTNPLDFSGGFPPTLFVSNDDSLAERIQRAHPAARVVKTLNTVTAPLMVRPATLPGKHAVFVCGDDDEAKATVTGVLEGFGWQDVVDLGDLSNARGTEAWLLLWTRLYGALGTDRFNLAILREES